MISSSFPSCVTVMFCLLCPLLVASLQAEEWPRWRGPRGDSTWKTQSIPEKWPEGGLKPAWTKPIGGGYGGIAVSGGKLYVMDYHKQPEEVERVLCLDALTGGEIWSLTYPVRYLKLDYGNGPRSTPTVYDGRVYTFGALGHARCLDAESGKVLWEKNPSMDYQVTLPEWGLAASPLIVDNLVVFHPGAKPDACLIAFDRVTGRETWRTGKDPAGYSTPILADTPSGKQLIHWSPKHVLGFNPATGTQNWQIPYDVTYGVSIATPLYQEGLVFVSGYWEGSKAIRLGSSATDAKLEWEDTKTLRGLMAPPLYRGGLVYSLDKQLGLTCFELATGKKIWDDGNKMTPRGRNPQASMVWLEEDTPERQSPTTPPTTPPTSTPESPKGQSNRTSEPGASDRVLILNSEGELILARFNRTGYHESDRAKIIDPTWAHPALGGNFVYARNDTTLVCVPLNPIPVSKDSSR